jgi:hypothetical protein
LTVYTCMPFGQLVQCVSTSCQRFGLIGRSVQYHSALRHPPVNDRKLCSYPMVLGVSPLPAAQCVELAIVHHKVMNSAGCASMKVRGVFRQLPTQNPSLNTVMMSHDVWSANHNLGWSELTSTSLVQVYMYVLPAQSSLLACEPCTRPDPNTSCQSVAWVTL